MIFNPPVQRYEPSESQTDKTTNRQGNRLHPVLQEFKELIESDPVIHAEFLGMFEQVPLEYRTVMDPNIVVAQHSLNTSII